MKNLQECLKGSEPFMKLGNGKQAPALNYNLPQKSSFIAYGTQPIYLNEMVFNEKAKHIPNKLSTITMENYKDLARSLQKDIETGTNQSNLISGLEKISNSKFLISQTNDFSPKNRSSQENSFTNLEAKTTVAKIDGYDLHYIIEELTKNKAAVVTESFGNYKQKLSFISRPKQDKCFPMLFIIEEYKTAS